MTGGHPPVPAEDGCHVLHVEVDVPAVQVALAGRPELSGLPVVVVDAGRVRGASAPAHAFGVRAGDGLQAALARCPHAVVVEADPAAEDAVRAGLLAVLADVTAIVEPVGGAAAYVDVGGARRRLGPPTAIAWTVRERLREQHGVTCSVGIGTTKVAARLAGQAAGPDGVLLVPHAATPRFLGQHPVAALAEVDGPLEAALAAVGIRRLDELAGASPAVLRALGPPATVHWLRDLARGRDTRPVVPRPRPSDDPVVRVDVPCADAGGRRHVLDRLLGDAAHACGRALTARRQVCRTVTLTVRTADGAEHTRSRALGTPSGHGRELHLVARDLLAGLTWTAVPEALTLAVGRLRDVPASVRGPVTGEPTGAVRPVDDAGAVPAEPPAAAEGPRWRVSPDLVARVAQRSTTTIVTADIS